MSSLSHLDGPSVDFIPDAAQWDRIGKEKSNAHIHSLTLVPTLTFYSYVLVQFMKEAARRRRHDTCALIVPLRSENARLANDKLPGLAADRTDQWRDLRPAMISRSGDAPEDAGVASANVIITRLRNRLVTYPSGAGRLAAKGAAKG